MESQDRRADIKRLIDTLRRVTTAVQVLPFVYSAIYIIVLVVYNFSSMEVQSTLDTLFYVSPIIIIGFLLLSKLLCLCMWHKIACSLPVVPQIISFIDCYIFTFSDSAVYVFNGMLIIMTAILLIASYNVFLK